MQGQHGRSHPYLNWPGALGRHHAHCPAQTSGGPGQGPPRPNPFAIRAARELKYRLLHQASYSIFLLVNYLTCEMGAPSTLLRRDTKAFISTVSSMSPVHHRNPVVIGVTLECNWGCCCDYCHHPCLYQQQLQATSLVSLSFTRAGSRENRKGAPTHCFRHSLGHPPGQCPVSFRSTRSFSSAYLPPPLSLD